MNHKLFNILGAALAFLVFVGCDDKDEPIVEVIGDEEFDVQFVLPESIYSSGSTEATFTVIDGKAPLLTDSFIFEPVEHTDNTSYSTVCSISKTSSASFSVTVPSSLSAGRYNIYIKRGRDRLSFGELPVYYTSSRSLKVLFIGNSFTEDAVNHLPGMIKAAGLSNIKLVHMFYGGRTIPTYYSWYMTADDYTCYTCLPGADSWSESTGMTLHDAVRSDTWDVVSIQEYSGTYFAWEWTENEKNAINGLIDYIKDDQSSSEPKIEYIMSQAFADLSIIPSGSQSHITFSTTEEMFYVIAAQGEKVLAETEVDEIIPTGTVLENLRTTSVNNASNLSRDGYHMDYGISRYAAGCAIFEQVISPIYNLYLDGNTYRYSTRGVPVTDANQPIALQAARYAIENPFVITDMSGY